MLEKYNLLNFHFLYFSHGFVTAKMESRFSIPHDLQEERNLQENNLVSDVEKPPKSKRRKRKSRCLAPHLSLHYVL